MCVCVHGGCVCMYVFVYECVCVYVCLCVCVCLAEFCPKVFALSGHVRMCVPDMCSNTLTEQQQKEQVFSVGAAAPRGDSNICLILGDRQHI